MSCEDVIQLLERGDLIQFTHNVPKGSEKSVVQRQIGLFLPSFQYLTFHQSHHCPDIRLADNSLSNTISSSTQVDVSKFDEKSACEEDVY